MTSDLRNGLRNDDKEIAKPEWAAVGRRLASIRGKVVQPDRAAQLGVSKTTYGRWERGIREIGSDGLAALVNEGWNANWLLTGEGPERMADLSASPSPSQDLSGSNVSLAVQLLREAADAAPVPAQWTPAQQGEATAILARLLQIGTAAADVRDIAERQIKAFSGGKRGGGATGAGA